MKKYKILGIDVHDGRHEDFVRRILDLGKTRTSSYVCMANVHMTIEACDDGEFAEVVNGADLVAPDGMPLVVAIRLLHGKRQERVAGMDLMEDLIGEAAREGLSVFFLGSTEETLAKIEERLRREHDGARIAGSIAPPFRPMTEGEEEEVLQAVNRSGANILFVGMGCPKQERWMAKHRGRVHAVMVGTGAAFPVYAGLEKKAPEWMRRSSLEWLYRFGREPDRLWKRYLYTNSKYLVLLTRELLRRRS